LVEKGADKSLARPDWNKTIEGSFFVRRGGHCCRGDLVGRTTFWIVFEWLSTVKSLVTVACFIPGRAKDLAAPRYITEERKKLLRTARNLHILHMPMERTY